MKIMISISPLPLKNDRRTIAIIGAGFCGLAIAWFLLHSRPPFCHANIRLFDSKKLGQGTSGLAAGLLHPYAGAHAKLNWRGWEGIHATKELLQIASQTLGQPVTAENLGILRLALNPEQQMNFQYCAQQYPQTTQWLSLMDCQRLTPGCALAPGLWIKGGLTVYPSLYLQGLWAACQQRGVQFEQRHIISLKETQEFDLTIVTTGAETLALPELSFLPLKLVKGQLLEFAWPSDLPPLTCTLNSHIYLVMTERNLSCLVGATYEKGYAEATTNITIAAENLLPHAYQLFPPLKEFSMIGCHAGLRAVTAQHRPLMHRLSSSVWILTGMGSKGLLYHALYAKELIAYLEREFHAIP
jgi:glycine/D-amino acid oxidase-like deaminating enzyme